MALQLHPEVTDGLRREFAPTGKLRVAINLGNVVLAQRDAATGEARGISVALARELARRLDLEVDVTIFEAAGKAFAALREGACDLGFLAIDPKRAEDLAFSPPYVLILGTYLVRQDSRLREIADFDRPGIRIAVNQGAAYDLHLTRSLTSAELVRSGKSSESMALFRAGGADALASVRQRLVAWAEEDPSLRVIDGGFMRIEHAMALPRGRPAASRFLRNFIEEAKASGFVAKALAESGQDPGAVAPPG